MDKLGVTLALLLGIVLVASFGYGVYKMTQDLTYQVHNTIEQGLMNLDH